MDMISLLLISTIINLGIPISIESFSLSKLNNIDIITTLLKYHY